MGPISPSDNALYRLVGDTEMFAKLLESDRSGRVKLSNFQHVGFRQFVFRVTLSSQRSFLYCLGMLQSASLTTFGNLIGHIQKIVANKKMIWIYTQRGIAFVKHVCPVRNFTTVYCPRVAMSVHEFSGNAECSVAFGARTSPKPAAHWTGFINSAEKMAHYLHVACRWMAAMSMEVQFVKSYL